ncbi:MAG: 30S ribosomal protein S20 [Gemmataceae bacterium]
MPHTRSAKKQIRKDEKRRVHNRAIKRTIKSEVKKALSIAEAGSIDELTKQYNEAVKKLDKAAAKRIVHPNMAARKKAQLAKLLHKKKTAAAK